MGSERFYRLLEHKNEKKVQLATQGGNGLESFDLEDLSVQLEHISAGSRFDCKETVWETCGQNSFSVPHQFICVKEVSYRFLCTVVHKARVHNSVVKIGIHNLTQSYICIV